MLNLDPPDTMLIPVKSNGMDGTRMASPIITRPLKLATGEAIAMIVILNTRIVPPLRLVGKGPNLPIDISRDKIRNIALVSYHRSPLGPSISKGMARSPNGSALEAFIIFAKDENLFDEVKA